MTIEIRNLCKSFKDVKAVQNVNLIVESGESVALLGPNGAGKTTLVEMIEGVQYPDSGKIHILDRSWEKDENILRKQMGIALQETRFLERLTVEETLNLFASFYSLEKKRTREVIEIIQLESKRTTWVLHLSGGQRQRIGIARALYNNPQLLILDEATSALDDLTEKSVIDEINNLSDKITIILIAHRLSTIKKCNMIYVLDHGKIQNKGKFEELIKTSNHFSLTKENIE